MVSSKVIGVSCAFVLCLGLSNVTGAAAELGLSTGVDRDEACTDKNVEREIGVEKCRERQGIDIIKGKVLHVEGNDYLIQRFNGKEVRFLADANTQRTGLIREGDHIQAKVIEVNHEKQVVYIRPLE